MVHIGEWEPDHQRTLVGVETGHQHAETSTAHRGVEEMLAMSARCDGLGAIVDRDRVLLALRHVCSAIAVDDGEDARRGAEGRGRHPIQTQSLVPLAGPLSAAASREEAKAVVPAWPIGSGSAAGSAGGQPRHLTEAVL